MRYAFAERRRWFEDYLHRIEEGVTPAPRLGARYTCPCCGYPTLSERVHYEICDLCHWEDDGQDDPDADAVWGGPNYDLSLSQARSTFALYLDEYPPEQANANYIGGADNATEKSAKIEMIAAFDDMLSQTEATDLNALWERVYRSQTILLQELDRKLHRHKTRTTQRNRPPEAT